MDRNLAPILGGGKCRYSPIDNGHKWRTGNRWNISITCVCLNLQKDNEFGRELEAHIKNPIMNLAKIDAPRHSNCSQWGKSFTHTHRVILNKLSFGNKIIKKAGNKNKTAQHGKSAAKRALLFWRFFLTVNEFEQHPLEASEFWALISIWRYALFWDWCWYSAGSIMSMISPPPIRGRVMWRTTVGIQLKRRSSLCREQSNL